MDSVVDALRTMIIELTARVAKLESIINTRLESRPGKDLYKAYADAYLAGATVREIVARFGVSHQTVYKALALYDISPRATGPKTGSKQSMETRRKRVSAF